MADTKDNGWVRRVLSQPLVQFAVVGVGLFALYSAVQDGAGADRHTLVVTAAQQQAIIQQHRVLWNREPTDEELRGLVEAHIRDEILFREAVAAGLDRDDPVVRRRMVQKMRFAAEAMAAEVPSEDELEAWLTEHPDDYRVEARYTFEHRLFDSGQRGESVQADVRDALQALRADPASAVGDATVLPPRLQSTSASQIAGQFGQAFLEQLQAVAPGRWEGPLLSSYGLHLVRIDSETEARPARLEEVRPAVVRDLMHDRERRAVETFVETSRAGYDITVESVSKE